MRLVFLTGALRILWDWIKPLLMSEAMRFISDTRVRALAIQSVEAAARTDLDGDGKFDHAFRELTAKLQAIGVEYYKGWVAMAVEAAYRRWLESQER